MASPATGFLRGRSAKLESNSDSKENACKVPLDELNKIGRQKQWRDRLFSPDAEAADLCFQTIHKFTFIPIAILDIKDIVSWAEWGLTFSACLKWVNR